MKLLSNRWGIDIELTISRPVLMAIENQQLFSNVVQELYDQTGGEAGTFVLSEGEILYEIGKAAELIINPYAVDFNNRKFMKKIYSDLCDISMKRSSRVPRP